MGQFFFFFQAEDGIRDVAVTGVQTCALPISLTGYNGLDPALPTAGGATGTGLSGEDIRDQYRGVDRGAYRSEEHTSELQSRLHLVCRLLLEKKKKTLTARYTNDGHGIDALIA